MSLILKGIDLPKEGEYIPMRIYGNGHIWVNGAYKGVAIQIPTPHGRLIEEGKILSPIMCRPKSLRLDDNAQYSIITLIEEAPTILEAEE